MRQKLRGDGVGGQNPLTLVKLHYKLDPTTFTIYIGYMETIKSSHENTKVSSYMATFVLVENSGHITAKVSSSLAFFFPGPKRGHRIAKVSSLSTFSTGCPKPAIELLRSAVFHRCAQNRP